MKIHGTELRDAVEYTAEQTGFSARLIEKDYYCSLVLKGLYENEDLASCLLFKGGTLLAKGYGDFFRLSEDLDFSVANHMCGDRSTRRKFSELLRKQINVTIKSLELREVAAFKGANESRQYNAVFQYDSVIGPPETIKFDLGLRNDVIDDIARIELRTILLNPFSGSPQFPNFSASALSLDETYAEKTRAALTRMEPAIRDFFDLWIAHKGKSLPSSEKFYSLTAKKIELDKLAKIDLTLSKKKLLESQIKNELNTVLKADTAAQFRFSEAWELVQEISRKVQSLMSFQQSQR